ncbi:uncharacterized protein LOC108103979 [Drosophila eugracilis]|uniref:uncharacterized protein LOC108103979 n=1 Tax=Drosophila eugracilis TaxID=29029 RepID=UPI0007E79B8D|nr:uncharacterized protein LOC108103979 [Drosophila eugracilis]
MKPDQLNRLIRVNKRMQPWFLRNTSELYESAIRSYYERGYSTGNHPRFRTENIGPLRRIKKAEIKPNSADNYPCNHILQADQAAQSNANHFLYTMIQANRPRSISFSATRPYASPYGHSSMRRNASSSCSSGSSSGSSRTEIIVGSLRKSKAKRERKSRSLRKNRDTMEEHLDMDMDMDMDMFCNRSSSMPPLPSTPVLGARAMMAPCRQHHMAAMAKSLAQPMQILQGEGDSLMPVNAALKRRISVINHLKDGRRNKTELGHKLSTGSTRNGSPITGNGRNPTEMRFRFQTLGDRVKQFEYIQFADGPVASYAFNRNQKRAITTFRDSPRHRIENTTKKATIRRLQVTQQPRQLSFHNILHSNYRQRSKSLVSGADQLMESLGPITRLATPKGPQLIGRTTRGSSLDSSSRTSFRSSPSIITYANTLGRNKENSEKIPGVNFGYSKSSEVTSGDWVETPEDWPKYPRSSSSLGSGFGSTLTIAEKNLMSNENKSNESGGIFTETWKTFCSNGGSSALKSKRVNSEPLRAPTGGASEATTESFSKTLHGQDEPSRATLTPLRRLQLQQRSLQASPEVDDPTAGDLAHCLFKIKDNIKHTIKDNIMMKKSPTMQQKIQHDKPRVTKVTSNQVSRSSHRSFFLPSEEHQLLDRTTTTKRLYKDKTQDKKPVRIPIEKSERVVRAVTSSARTPAHLKGANQLLVASASQVSAYKRAFRNQQQILKAEILHQQAQQSQNTTTEEVSRQTSNLQSHRGSIPSSNKSTNRPILKRNAATSGAKAPKLNEAKLAGSKTDGSEMRRKVFKGSPSKVAAAPVTAHLKRTPQPASKAAQPTSTQKGKAVRTTTKGAPTGAVTTGEGGGAEAVRRAGKEAEVAGAAETTTRRSTLALAAQQQHSHSGNSLLGFRRETVNGAAAALLQRHEADEPLSQSQSPSPSTSVYHSQTAQKRRQFHFPYPPWRPSY